jgi:hypothetical protein
MFRPLLMDAITSLTGPVERVGDAFVLQIPLDAGGARLAASARGIGHVEGEDLVVRIPGWLAEKLGIAEGSYVTVDNRDGKFNITVAGDPAG